MPYKEKNTHAQIRKDLFKERTDESLHLEFINYWRPYEDCPWFNNIDEMAGYYGTDVESLVVRIENGAKPKTEESEFDWRAGLVRLFSFFRPAAR